MEQQQISSPGLADMLAGLKRRIPLILAIGVTGSLLALIVAWVLPPVFTAKATVLVESQQIPSDLARSTVTASVAERLKVIEQRLMTRETLLSVARDLDVFRDRPEISPSERVDVMREATELVPITLGNSRRGDTTVAAFTIGYTAHRSGLASGVANEFVTLILEQNLRERSARATETNEFFKAELDRLQSQITDTAGEIARFKTENEVALPDSLGFRRSELAAIEERIFERSQRRLELEEQRRTIEETLAAGLPLDERQLSPAERELQGLRRTLEARQAVMSDRHPQIRALKARIAALEGTVTPASADNEEAETRRSLAERRLARQADLIGTQIEFLDRQTETDTQRITALEESIAATPQVEMRLAALERRYADLAKQRDVAVTKQAEAATGERLEVNRQAERFEVIEQAQPPAEPDAPNRPLIAGGGVAASFGLGIGLALMLTLADRTIRNPGDLERRLGLRPVVTVPYIATSGELQTRRRRRLILAGILLVGIPFVLILIDQFVMPLPFLAERFVTKTGLDDMLWAIEQRLGL